MKIFWDENTCTHSGKCVQNLPYVFTVQSRKFVIVQDGAPEDQIRETVKKYPSGTLRIKE